MLCVYLLTKDSKAGLLGALPPMHPREFAGCEDQSDMEVQSPGGGEMSLEDLLLPSS